MEFLLRWWDEFDDTVDASRELVRQALSEIGSAMAPHASAVLALMLAALRPG